MIEVLLIAVSLALDAFAVSVSSGISVPGFGWKQAVRMGLYFGFFQFAMPLIGWFLGTSVSGYIEALDHWVAFALLAIIGGRMVWGARDDSCETESGPVELTCRRLVMLAVATSIDALAVGITFAFLEVDILPAVCCIALTTFLLSSLGVKFGSLCGTRMQSKAEALGGVILILLGLKILLEHLGIF